MNLSWSNLRDLNGSQHTAFEELCCQLAAAEPTPVGAVFTRMAPPDAGIEAYWTLASGEEWGWQAKFFQSPPGAAQWRQIDESVEEAITTHPQLRKFTVCLPIDRSDARSAARGSHPRQSFMDRWKVHVQRWQAKARHRGMTVAFEYWGQHEIFSKLAAQGHRGRVRFWFDFEFLSRDWFDDRLSVVLRDAGERYTPELNVDLPVVKLFDGLGRTESLSDEYRALSGKLERAYRSLRQCKSSALSNALDAVASPMPAFLSLVSTTKLTGVAPAPLEDLSREAAKCLRRTWDCLEQARKLDDDFRRARGNKGDQQSTQDESAAVRTYASELASQLRDYREFVDSPRLQLVNTAALLLDGDAGTGKTHLFCDVASNRLKAGLPTVLILGQQLGRGEPWAEIITRLGLSCDRDEFLGALGAAAQACGSRALVMVDALNEGEGRLEWKNNLAGFLAVLDRHPWVGVALSVRTSYVATVIPSHVGTAHLVRETHQGFTDHEYEATKVFFNAFGIRLPSVPLLHPEFSNPLFLKLLCKGLKAAGQSDVPRGFRGLSRVFDFWIDATNTRLSEEARLDFDRKNPLVRNALHAAAREMANAGRPWLGRAKAQQVVDELLPGRSWENSLFCHLITEGLLAEDRVPTSDGPPGEIIRFAYERLADHLIVDNLVSGYSDAATLKLALAEGGQLAHLVKDQYACYGNQGMLDALAIQLPEKVGKELPAIVPLAKMWLPVIDAFVRSLVWRMPTAITTDTTRYLNAVCAEARFPELLETFLTVAGDPDHPYNADFLHRNLSRRTMAERDAWWSIFLHDHYGEHGAVDRLVEWSSTSGDRAHISDASVSLVATALAWFLTTSNRYLRDRATKALVNLLTPRLHLVQELLQRFATVDDLYVRERLFAVAYGCAMRARDDRALAGLAQYVYDKEFRAGTPTPHLLLRDYARGVVELAIHRKKPLKVQPRLVRPPYRSKWVGRVPSEAKLKPFGEWRENLPEPELARLSIFHSVMGMGDFARYIIGTNSGHFEWSSRRLGSKRLTVKERFRRFKAGLQPEQATALQVYLQARSAREMHERFSGIKMEGADWPKIDVAALRTTEEASKQTFLRVLPKGKRGALKSILLPYLENRGQREDAFDLRLAQRWVFARVLALGWTPERFGRFDRRVDRNGMRSSHKAERIGKKYQWLAWHEWLARVSDNFEYRGEVWSDAPAKYEGPWQHLDRDIDPSVVLTSTRRESWKAHTRTWWMPVSYQAWEAPANTAEWLKNLKDLPQVPDLLRVTDPDGAEWLSLDGYFHWKQPVPAEVDPHEVPRREIWYIVRGYIVSEVSEEKFLRWGRQQNFMGRWMPDPPDHYGCALGEMFWGPPFFGQGDGWITEDRVPVPLRCPAANYVAENGARDCSLDETMNIAVPAAWLMKLMSLESRGEEGIYRDSTGAVVAQDPSVRASGASVLLLRRDALERSLKSHGLKLVWTVLGEKQALAGGPAPMAGRLTINGVYRLSGGGPTGSLKGLYES